jgi:tetratricopeptide (TPR) repeat protein
MNKTIRISLEDLLQFSGQPVPNPPPDETAILAIAREQFAFLPQPVDVSCEGSTVVVSFAEESPSAQAEAKRLAERAAKRAAEGNYDKAIGIFKRVLELQPSLTSARRDLAMVYAEKGQTEQAKDHLIDVLRSEPSDAWALVVLANLYIRDANDISTG